MGIVLTPTKYGPMLCAALDPYMGRALIQDGEFAHDQMVGWKPYIPEGGVVLEIGAHVGAHTLAFARHVGPEGGVIAFEPQWMCYAMLCGTMALNEMRNVRAHWMGLGAEEGVGMIPAHDFGQVGNFGATAMCGVGEPVPIRTLDSFTIGQCDFLKIDVEGMEFEVLRGAEQTILTHKPVIGCESETKDGTPKIAAWLKERGYRVKRYLPRYGIHWPKEASFDLLCVPKEREFYPNPDTYEEL